MKTKTTADKSTVREQIRVLAYRCDKGDDFWAYLKARGFDLDFVDREELLLKAVDWGKADVVLTTEGDAWTRVTRAVRRKACGSKAVRLLLLPLGGTRVSVFEPKGKKEKMPSLRAYAQLARTVEQAVAKKGADDQEDYLARLAETVVALSQQPSSPSAHGREASGGKTRDLKADIFGWNLQVLLDRLEGETAQRQEEQA